MLWTLYLYLIDIYPPLEKLPMHVSYGVFINAFSVIPFEIHFKTDAVSIYSIEIIYLYWEYLFLICLLRCFFLRQVFFSFAPNFSE